ncbi:MAG: hypothetical protein ACRDQI_02190 [Pseudonocardiaceae bacterium]
MISRWGQLPRTYIRTSQDEVIPVQVQDSMVAEADQLTPSNPFTVHTIADILTCGVGKNRGTAGHDTVAVQT